MWQVGNVLIEAGSLIQAGSPIQGICSNRSRGLVLEVLRYNWFHAAGAEVLNKHEIGLWDNGSTVSR